MRVLISGITGFVGAHLARALAAHGHEVSGFTNDAASLEGFAVAQVDLLDVDALTGLVREQRPEAVIHLAGLSHVGASFDRPDAYHRVNVDGTENVLRASSSLPTNPRVIVASSAEIYGRVPEAEQPIDESRAPDPRSPYAESKVRAERLALEAGAIVTRSFNIVGPGQAPTFALPSFARQLLAIQRGEQEPVLAVGDLSPRRDFTHCADAIDAYRTLLEAGTARRVYNVASGTAVSIGEALERLMAVSGVAAEVRCDPGRVRPVDVPLLLGDSSRLRALGWRPAYDLDAAVRDLWHSVDLTSEGEAE